MPMILRVLLVVFSLAGCAGVSGLPNPAGPAHDTTVPATGLAASVFGLRPSWYRPAPALVKKGVYVAEYYTNAILAYDWKTRENRPPICTLPAAFVVDVATDRAGNLIDPDGGSRTVTVHRGPAMCGPVLGQFADTDGQPSDATTSNAASTTIYVANLQATNRASGDVSACTLVAGCTRVLSNAAIGGELFAVAEDPSGNVYASGYATPSTGAALVYWKAGKGAGSLITAYRNGSPGGLDVDRQGNLLALDTFAGGTGALWVYGGCPATCNAHGPFPLRGESVFGKVDVRDRLFEAADFEYGQIDVYRYGGVKGVTYLYSFADGLDPSGDVEGIALDPAAED
jgi:hypothetical protein